MPNPVSCMFCCDINVTRSHQWYTVTFRWWQSTLVGSTSCCAIIWKYYCILLEAHFTSKLQQFINIDRQKAGLGSLPTTICSPWRPFYQCVSYDSKSDWYSATIPRLAAPTDITGCHIFQASSVVVSFPTQDNPATKFQAWIQQLTLAEKRLSILPVSFAIWLRRRTDSSPVSPNQLHDVHWDRRRRKTPLRLVLMDCILPREGTPGS